MPKLPNSLSPAKVGGWMRLWKSITSLSGPEIARQAERPFSLALVGADDHTALLAARLALETPVPRDSAHGPANIQPYITLCREAPQAPPGSIVLYAEPLTADEARLAEALARIVVDRPDLQLSLARHVPAFRPAVAAKLINDASWENAKIALVSALPGIIPFTDFLMPATALGDMVLLTKNQAVLLLKLAAAYGKPVDLRARSKELLPIVGGGFGWRAIARELIGLVPGGIGVGVKGAVAYAGTYTVGKAAAIFFSTGQTLSGPRLRQLYRDALQEAGGRVRHLLRREKPGRDALPASPAPAVSEANDSVEYPLEPAQTR